MLLGLIMEKTSNNNIFKISAVVILYALITLVAVFRHEIWADEAQVWMICKNLTFFGLFEHLVNEGHPSFFYLLLMPFAKLGSNIIYMQLVCWLSSVIAVFLLWRYSKFNTLTKTIITLSAPFLYFFPAVARNYSLIAPLVFSLAILHDKTDKHPYLYSFLLVFLVNTHAIMFCFSFLLALRFLYKNVYIQIKNKSLDKSCAVSGGIILFGIFALIFQLMGTTSSNCFIKFGTDEVLASAIRVILLFLFNSFDSHYLHSHIKYFNPYTLGCITCVILSYLTLFVYFLIKNKKLFAFLLLSVGFQFVVYILTYNYYVFPTRIYSCYMIFLFCCWVLSDINAKNNISNKAINILISFMFILTLWNGIFNYYGDFVFEYSASKSTAAYIKQNINPKNSILFIDFPPPSIPVAYYLNDVYDLRDVRSGNIPFKYVRWTKSLYKYLSDREWEELFKKYRESGETKDLYAVVIYNIFKEPKNLNTLGEKYFDLFYVSGDALDYVERFKIYKYKF